MKIIDIMIVDDQKLFVESLKKLLEYGDTGIKVVDFAYSGEEAIQKLRNFRPTLILMDIRMNGIDGVEATRIVIEKYPSVKVIILTMFEDDEYVYRALKVGASGYLLKDIPSEELITGIHAAISGNIMITPKIVKSLLHENLSHAKISKEIFSRREVSLISLILKGRDNQQIADELFLSEQTVRNYISSIYSKCNVKKRSQLVSALQEISSEF